MHLGFPNPWRAAESTQQQGTARYRVAVPRLAAGAELSMRTGSGESPFVAHGLSRAGAKRCHPMLITLRCDSLLEQV